MSRNLYIVLPNAQMLNMPYAKRRMQKTTVYQETMDAAAWRLDFRMAKLWLNDKGLRICSVTRNSTQAVKKVYR